MEQDTDLLEFENLSLPERALDRVVQNSMKNDPAGIYLLVAPSGAGKSYAIKRGIRARTIAGTAPGGLQISFFCGHLITSYAIDYVPDNTILFATWLDQRVFSQNDLSSVVSLLDIAKKAVSDRGMRFYIATSNVMLARKIMIYAPTTKLLCSGEDIANLKMTDTEASTLVSSAGGQHPEWTPLTNDQRSLLLTNAAIAGTPEFIFSSMQDLSARTTTVGKIDYLNGVAKAQATFISSQWDACIQVTKDKKFQAIAKI